VTSSGQQVKDTPRQIIEAEPGHSENNRMLLTRFNRLWYRLTKRGGNHATTSICQIGSGACCDLATAWIHFST